MSKKKTKINTTYLNHGLALAWCMLIFALSAQNNLGHPPQLLPFQDKIAHAMLYACLAFFACMSFRHLCKKTVWVVMLAWLFCALYGISDEWHQSFVAQRVPDVWDWVADIFGAAMMCMLLYLLYPNVLRGEKT